MGALSRAASGASPRRTCQVYDTYFVSRARDRPLFSHRSPACAPHLGNSPVPRRTINLVFSLLGPWPRLSERPSVLLPHAGLPAGEHLSDAFARVNPMKKVPAMMDGGFTLCESVAILLYLAHKYKVPDHWYPQDLQARARVDEYLAWQHTGLRRSCLRALWHKVRPEMGAWGGVVGSVTPGTLRPQQVIFSLVLPNVLPST